MLNSPLKQLRTSWYWKPILRPFLLTRCILLLLGTLAIWLGPMHSRGWHISAHAGLDMWTRWDSGYYLETARAGYQYVNSHPSHMAFFPLYPLAIRWLTLGSRQQLILALAGWLLSNAATLLALGLIYRMVAQEWDDSLAQRTIWCLLLFPTGFFLSMVYTEGLFLLLSAGTFYFARQQRWLAAAILGALAAATRSIGVCLLLPLVYLWYQQQLPRWRDVLWLLLIPCGLLLFMIYLYRAFGDPWLFVHAVTAWGRAAGLQGAKQNLLRLVELVENPELRWRLWSLGKDVLFSILGIYLFLRSLTWRNPPYQLYSLCALGIPLASCTVVSMPRYLIVIFPLFIAMAQLLNTPARQRWGFGLSAGVQAVFMVQWSLWYWVA